ncbi:MAG TPA: hypothetical protein VK498_09035 [Ferruginibacter sp.]|nr:hypothetical protein [Ferruginibacter sp.]
MLRKHVILIALLIISIGVYLYLHNKVLKAKDFEPDNSKKETPVDLRPKIIAKLQQLVKDGSYGLYKLSIDSLSTNVLTSKVTITGASLDIDSSALKKLHNLQLLPDEIFRIKINSIHFDGLGIADLLQKNQLELSGINIEKPVIDVYHQALPYNAEERTRDDSSGLFNKLSGQLKKLFIGKINIDHGILVHHNLDKNNMITRMDNVFMQMKDLLIDSTTLAGQQRKLSIKQTTIRAENYNVLTSDHYYRVRIGSIGISSETNQLVAKNILLEPNGGRAALRKKLKYRNEIFHIIIPDLELKGVDWQDLINGKKIKANIAILNNGSINAFCDKSLPAITKKQNNFPHQLLMRIPIPLSVDKILTHHFKVIYEEYNPKVKKAAMVTFNEIEGSIEHLSNIKEEIKAQPEAFFKCTGKFMNDVPMNGKIVFDLARVTGGHFTGDLKVGALNNTLINTVSETLSLFSVKRGKMQQGIAHVSANNKNAQGSISLYYDDLHITPLKPDSTGTRELKSSHLKSFIANKILIKNSNPSNGKLRQPSFSVIRNPESGFFRLIWESITAGMVKSIGVPVKLVLKNAE